MSMGKKQKILFGWSLTTQTEQFRLCALSVSAVNVRNFMPPLTTLSLPVAIHSPHSNRDVLLF